MSRPLTLTRGDPIPFDDEVAIPAIMKRKMLKYPIASSVSQTSAAVNDIRIADRAYRKGMEHQNIIDEIAMFESRVLGEKKPKVPKVAVAAPTKEQIELLQSTSPPSPKQFWDIFIQPQTSPVSPRTMHIQSELANLPFSAKCSPRAGSHLAKSPASRVKPAVWTLLDEPSVPSVNFGEHRPLRKKHVPFLNACATNNDRGIPLVTDKLKYDRERKGAQHEEAMRVQQTRERAVLEKAARKRTTENLNASRKKREDMSQRYAMSGQGWVEEKMAQVRTRRKEAEEVCVLSPDVLDALAFLERRDEMMRNSLDFT